VRDLIRNGQPAEFEKLMLKVPAASAESNSDRHPSGPDCVLHIRRL
jgi:hypothetical protein